MTNYILYLFEANCSILLCGLFYFLFLRKETDFRGKRFYIIGSALLSLAVPLLHLNFLLPEAATPLKGMQALILPEIVIGEGAGTTTSAATQASPPLYIYAYLAGAIVLLSWFLFQLGQVVWFYSLNYSRKVSGNGYTLIHTNGTLPTFSFFRVLFLDNSIPLSETEEERIIAHEEAHIRENHSLDIILLEVTKILFWFNPVTWFFRNEIQDIHEFLADDVSAANETDEYSSLLAKMALNKAHLPIGHHFNKSKTLKRIKMMKTTKTKINNWKWLSTLSMVMIILAVFSCNDEAMTDIQKVMDESAVSMNIPPEIQTELDRLQKEDPSGEFVYLETSLDNEDEVARLKQMDPNTIAMVNVNKEENFLGMIIKKNGTMNRVVEGYQEGSDVFVVVEEPAEPQGGMTGFYNYIAQNLKYPEKAKNAGIQGKVYVQMVIDKDGSVTEVEVLKGIGYGCDEEARRVIAESPSWTPGVQRGKKVKQRVIVPIAFSLEDGASSSSVIELQPGGKLNIEALQEGLAVHGKVKDENGNPMAGVNIVIEGTNVGTVSDLDGTYKIKLENTDQVLRYSFVGYASERKTFK